MLEGCESEWEPPKSSQNKMATMLLKSSIPHLSMLHTDCYHAVIGIKACHQKFVLSISPRESVWGGGISPRPLLYHPRPIPLGWLATQVSGDRA